MRGTPGGCCCPPTPTLCSGRCARGTGLLLTLLAVLLLLLSAQRSLWPQLSRYGGAVGWEWCGPPGHGVVLLQSHFALGND